MDIKCYTNAFYGVLIKKFPDWPLSLNFTRAFVHDFSYNYEIIEKNPELIPCNIKYAGIVIKKEVASKVIKYLSENLKR